MVHLIDPQEANTIALCILKFCGLVVPLYGIHPTPI